MSQQDMITNVRKQAFRAKLENLLDNHRTVLIVTADKVGSNQMQHVRLALRGKGVLLMGKTTLMQKVIRDRCELLKKKQAPLQQSPSTPEFDKLLPFISGNIGFVFTNPSDAREVCTIIEGIKMPAPAKAGAVAPADYFVGPMGTGLDPSHTSFFQASGIATRIVQGQVQIVNEVQVTKRGQRVTPTQVVLLSKLGIKPFHTQMTVTHMFDGEDVCPATALRLSPLDLAGKFHAGLSVLAALSDRIGAVDGIGTTILSALQLVAGGSSAQPVPGVDATPTPPSPVQEGVDCGCNCGGDDSFFSLFD